jgi:tRNA nucleotidyltransferase (CCA-adding enzyme)
LTRRGVCGHCQRAIEYEKGHFRMDVKKNMKSKMKLPGFVKTLLERLHGAGFEAYVVGGAVRDMVMGRTPGDWDVVTSASPEEIESTFDDVSHFAIQHDTVTLVNRGEHYEVTPFRGEADYGGSVEEDLGYRDFTINAMAYDAEKETVLDPHGGREDISRKLVRAVGNPRDRFLEDPIRLLRAVRVAAELRFRVEAGTLECIAGMAEQVASAARERIREEMMKILMTRRPSTGFNLLAGTGLLDFFLPELLEGYRMKQNSDYHRYTVFKHVMETIDRVDPDPVLRLSALFHDIAKPRVREKIAGKYRFYGHEEASTELAGDIMARLKFSNEMTGKVSNLIAHHMIGYDSNWGEGAVRRLIRRVGPENMDRMLSLYRADLLAHGMRDHRLDLFSELEKRVGDVTRKPLAVKTRDLAIDGNTVMEILGLSTGPEVGRVLEMLMEKVTDRPSLNTRENLIALLEDMKR